MKKEECIMSFFSKLFGKKDETNDFIKMVMESKRRNEVSPNYQVSCAALRVLFYSAEFSTDLFYNNLPFAKMLVQRAIDMCKIRKIKIPVTYQNLPITFVTNIDGSKYGYIVAFDDAKYECECNFIAMMIINGKKEYYTNEFYADSKSFGLCMFGEEGNHYSGINGMQPKTYEEFKDAILD